MRNMNGLTTSNSHEKHEGLYRLTLSCMAFLPLKFILPEPRVKHMVAEQRKKIEERAGSLPPGLKEQYDIQLEVLESGEGADVEYCHIPGHLIPSDTLQPGKTYMTAGPVRRARQSFLRRGCRSRGRRGR